VFESPILREAVDALKRVATSLDKCSDYLRVIMVALDETKDATERLADASDRHAEAAQVAPTAYNPESVEAWTREFAQADFDFGDEDA